jgi:serralysin
MASNFLFDFEQQLALVQEPKDTAVEAISPESLLEFDPKKVEADQEDEKDDLGLSTSFVAPLSLSSLSSPTTEPAQAVPVLLGSSESGTALAESRGLPLSGSSQAAGSPIAADTFGVPVAAVAVGATGDNNIDGLLRGVRWASGSISFSFTDSIDDYEGGYADRASHGASFQTLNATQRDVARRWIGTGGEYYDVGASISPFELTGASDRDATIRMAMSDVPGTAFAYYPNGSTVEAGDAWFNRVSYNSPQIGNYAYHTFGHELGHAMGLKHGQELGGPANVSMNANRDSMEFSIMTYRSYVGHDLNALPFYTNESGGYAQSLMMYDIAAIQHMYGAYFGNNAGNTTYTFSTTTGEMFVDGLGQGTPVANRVFRTIWDGNGIDTYDFSNYSTNLSVDLTPGGWSDLSVGGTFQKAALNAGFGGIVQYARGHVFNALQYQGDARSLIENANGGSGNDQISGNSANNNLQGGGGNDTIDGGSGVDVMNGNDGNDTFRIFNGWTGGAGEVMDGGAGSDTFDLSGVVGITTTNINLAAGTFNYTPGGSGTISLLNIENVISGAWADTIIGNSANNNLQGGGGNDTIDGGSGVDVMNGNDGDDTFRIFNGWTGGTGEVMDGGAGSDTFDLSGVVGITTTNINLAAGTFNYTPGGSGTISLLNIENVISGAWADTIIGNSANNNLQGGGGNDTIDGGSGVDVMNGNDGDDTFRIFNGWTGGTGEVMDGGAGSDTFDLSGVVGITTTNINLAAGTFNYTPGGSGTISLLNIENVISGAWADTIIGNSANNNLQGGGGNDTIDGGSGVDTLSGGDGDDNIRSDGDGGTYLGGAGNDVMFSGLGPESMDGGTGVDLIDHTVFSGDYVFDMATGLTNFSPLILESYTNFENATMGAGNDNVTGNAAANVINGGAGNDALAGSSGNDTIDGGSGVDTLSGGDGSDNIRSDGDGGTYLGGAGNDVMFSGLGTETMDGGTGIDLIDHTAWGGAYVFDMATGLTNFGGELYINFENATMGAGNDNVTGNAAANVINGGAGNDTMNGGGGNDTLDGGSGIDTVVFGSANNTVNFLTGQATGDGNDRLSNFENAVGGDGNDNLVGSTGDNLLDGGNGNDTVTGGAGNDNLIGGAGTDTAVFGTGASILNLTTGQATGGGVGTDTLNGIENLAAGTGNDTLTGSGGNNLLDGGGDNDTINGAAGSDNLIGGTGNDSLLGGSGNDTLTGGGDGQIDVLTSGNTLDLDRFVLGTAGVAGQILYDTNLNGDYARITDFDLFGLASQVDRIQLRGVATDYRLANVTLGAFSGAGIYDRNGTVATGNDDLIGLIQGLSSTNFNLTNTSQFIYVV